MSIQVVSQGQTTDSQAAQSMTDLAKGEVKASESAEAAEEAADESADDSEASESGEDESKDESQDQQSEEKPKRKNGFKKRIEKLNKRIADQEREAQYWREQALNAAKSRDQEKPQLRAEPKPDQTGRPKQDDFDNHEDWLEAVADWKVEQKLAAKEREARQKDVQTSYQKQVNEHIARVDSFKETVEDFDDVIADVDDVSMSLAVEEVILQSDNGPALMYELAKNRDEYERICKLPPIAAARELGKIEARLAKESGAPAPKEEKKTTKAPKPISAVGAKGGAGLKKSIYDPSLSQADYERIRAEQLRDRRSW